MGIFGGYLNKAWSGQFQQEGGAFWWIYQYLFSPVVSTMFALLAFYVASAAFRAFRAKNLEAILLLVTALIVLIGQTKDREFTSFFLPAPCDDPSSPRRTTSYTQIVIWLETEERPSSVSAEIPVGRQ